MAGDWSSELGQVSSSTAAICSHRRHCSSKAGQRNPGIVRECGLSSLTYCCRFDVMTGVFLESMSLAHTKSAPACKPKFVFSTSLLQHGLDARAWREGNVSRQGLLKRFETHLSEVAGGAATASTHHVQHSELAHFLSIRKRCQHSQVARLRTLWPVERLPCKNTGVRGTPSTASRSGSQVEHAPMRHA